LVPQDPNDEPASELLKRIQTEKAGLMKRGKIRKEKPLPPIGQDETPFDLPKGWNWVRFGDLTQKLRSGSTPRGGKSVYQETGIKFIRSQNVWNDGLKLDNIAHITEEIQQKMHATIVKPKDILLNITGASIGRSALVLDDFDEGNVSQHVAIVRLVERSLRRYIHFYLISLMAQNAIMSAQVGISREGLSMAKLKQFIVPIPPLEEQKRIVAKVDQFMTLCDQLEARLKSAQEDGEKLLAAAVNA
ncbi:restriction endonuclease subunit S, partial [Candidatus Poribacteria bacterium]|nr:restriction endonuclease subunit S [Candidatus Poribacteria bacterium]